MQTEVAARSTPQAVVARLRLLYWGTWCLLAGTSLYFAAIFLSILRLLLIHKGLFSHLTVETLWASGIITTAGMVLASIDLLVYPPAKRRIHHREPEREPRESLITVALTAYNDEPSIAPAVRDFLAHPRVKRVIVVSNNSTDRTLECAIAAGALGFNEIRQGYGRCVYRCLEEATRFQDTELIALCEGDMTFRAADLDKFLAYMPHAEIVNGTRIVEQLRDDQTQLSTFMYYGNFFVGKLLEIKHLGQGTFTDVGTTYKMMRRRDVLRVLKVVNPRVNLEFNAHFLDNALTHGFSIVECPVTFHARVGVSKGGNVNNLRALKVGMRMIWGLTFGWGAN